MQATSLAHIAFVDMQILILIELENGCDTKCFAKSTGFYSSTVVCQRLCVII